MNGEFPGWSNVTQITVDVDSSEFDEAPYSWNSQNAVSEAYDKFVDLFFRGQNNANRRVTFTFADRTLAYNTRVDGFECLKYADDDNKT